MWKLLIPIAAVAALLTCACSDNTTVPDRPSLTRLLSAVTGDDGQIATFVSGNLPTDGTGSSGVISQNGSTISSTSIRAGDTVRFALATPDALSDILISLSGQPGYYDLPINGAGRVASANGFRLTVPVTAQLNTFVLRIVPRHRDGTIGPPQDLNLQILPAFVDQPPSPPFTTTR